MKKRIISAFLTLILCFGFAFTAMAAPDIDFVIDDAGYLSTDEIADLNTIAADIYDSCGVGIFYVFTDAETLEDYDVSSIVGGLEDYVIMMENDTSWFTFYGGKGLAIDLAAEEYLRDVYDETATYVEGVAAFLYAAAEYFPTSAPTVDTTVDTTVSDTGEYFVFDDADILTDSEEAALTDKLMSVSHTYGAQIVIATIDSMDAGDIDAFVEFAYDEMGFGYGENRDGAFMLVCMDPREYRILTNGMAGDAISSGAIDKIGDALVSDLSDGNYSAAFGIFADKCSYYLDGHINGFPFNFGKNIIIALIIGIIAGIIVAFVLKGQLKTVKKQNQANVYVKQGSMQVNVHNDFFLYRDVSRSKKESNSSSGGGSSRNVGGGSF